MRRPPRWNDPIGSACQEAAIAVGRGLDVRPTLYGFEDGQPTLRVQPGYAAMLSRREQVHALLVTLVPILGIRQTLLFTPARITDPSIDDPHLRAALATYGITVEVAERVGGEVSGTTHLVEHRREGDRVRWEAPQEIDHGNFTEVLHHALSTDRFDDDVSAMTTAYALSKWGVVVEVAPGWHERYGFARLVPRLERMVRPCDRRRARDLVRERNRQRRPTTAAGRDRHGREASR